MNRASAEAITVAFANTAASDTRASVAWNVERSASTSRANCLGMLSREAGHSRVPVPPHRITGRTWLLQSLTYFSAACLTIQRLPP
ncbi:hypothetical protein GOFOIKOB_6588 [Methylobacterium tardum]|nr:hypothetical protein GOFOIKOB_6588 [Methylobacterium tardum]